MSRLNTCELAGIALARVCVAIGTIVSLIATTCGLTCTTGALVPVRVR
ncbi:MAG: hypothetical protein U0570_15605 [Phycisphaerales bacterium]